MTTWQRTLTHLSNSRHFICIISFNFNPSTKKIEHKRWCGVIWPRSHGILSASRDCSF